MNFEINAGTLVVGALIFFLVVFVKPFFMILRDHVVWWWIERYLINEGYRLDISNYLHYEPSIFHRLNMVNTFVREPESDEYVYKKGKVEVRLTDDEFQYMLQDCRRKCEWYTKKKMEFRKKSNLYDTIVRHYGQAKLNPIEEDLSKNNNRDEKDEHVHILLIVAEYHTDKVMEYVRIPEDQG